MRNMGKMESFTGTCSYCGQTKIVMAESQKDANERVTLDCSCPGAEMEQRKKDVRVLLDALIGELAPDNGWDPADPEVYESILQMADRIAEESITLCSMRVDDTNLKISRSKGKMNIERSKTIRQGGSIEK